MEDLMEKLYQKAKRFDEGEVYQTQEYSDICKRQFALCKEMRRLFGPVLSQLLDEYTAAVSDECDLECRHFFEQGFLMRQASSK